MYPAYHYRRCGPRVRNKQVINLIVIVVLAILLINCLVVLSPFFSKIGHGLMNFMLAWHDRDPRCIIHAAVPVVAWSGSQEDVPAAPLARLFSPEQTRPLQILAYQIPLLAEVVKPEEPTALAAATKLEPVSEQAAAPSPQPLSEQSLVAIYNTHTGETYALTDGMERLNGKRGGVVKAAEALEYELENKYGVRVARSDNIHDTIYNDSYIKSQETMQKLLEDNPALQVMLDIHRDAGLPRENSLVTVDGQQVAPVLIIVGSDARSPFPTWRQNHSFAQELAAEIDKQYPGLCLGVRIQQGRYNQFLHSRALLLEVGSVSNSTEEAVTAARMLAGPVAEVVKRNFDSE